MRDKAQDEKYWSEYDGLQNAKHQLLKAYLGAWFPILSSWNGRVVYIDCHAGRGRHQTGHEGSPILAIRTLLNHNLRDRILSGSEVNFIFIESNQKNFESLQEEIKELGEFPDGISILPFQEDYEILIQSMLERLRDEGQGQAPTFAFVDPYGFNISMQLLNEMLKSPSTELVVNLMYRYIDMSIRNPSQIANMDKLFGTQAWREIAEISDLNERAEAGISLYCKQLSAKHVTRMNMYAENGVLKYVLVHATNHDLGREKIKEAMWKVTPDGSFSAFERDNPDQMVLIRAEPDLTALRAKLLEEFAGTEVSTNTLYEWLNSELFLKKHLHSVLRELRTENQVQVGDFEGRFAFKNNPVFKFSPNSDAK